MLRRLSFLLAAVVAHSSAQSSAPAVDPNLEELSFVSDGKTYVLIGDDDFNALSTERQKEILSKPKLGANLSVDYTGHITSSQSTGMQFTPDDGDNEDLNVLALSLAILTPPASENPFVPWELTGISRLMLERGIGLQVACHSAPDAPEQKVLYQRGFLRYRPSDEAVYILLPPRLGNKIVVSPDAWNTFMNLYAISSMGYPGKKEAVLLAPFVDSFLEDIYQKLVAAGYDVKAVDVPPILTAIDQENDGQGRELRYLTTATAGFKPEELVNLRKEWNFQRRNGQSLQDCQTYMRNQVSLKLFSPITALKLGQIYLSAEFANLSAMILQLYPPEPQPDGRLLTLNGMGGMTPVVDAITDQWIKASSAPLQKTLEIGTSFGLALLKAIEAGATDLTANDADIRHLLIFARTLQLRFPDHMNKVNLIPGRFPRDFQLTPQYDHMLMARVLHFMNSEELFQAMHAAFEILKPNGRLYIVALTPYVAAYKPFIEEFEKRKAAKEEYPGYVKNLADWTDAQLIPPAKQVAMGLHMPFMFLDPDVLSKLAFKVGFSVIRAEFLGLPYKSDLWGLDGRENVGMILEKPPAYMTVLHTSLITNTM